MLATTAAYFHPPSLSVAFTLLTPSFTAYAIHLESGDGGWKIDGDTKYFSSNAGLADVALVTARIENGREGAKGLKGPVNVKMIPVICV